MAQGKMKKSKNADVVAKLKQKKGETHKFKPKLRKGSRNIAPKKEKVILKKNVQKKIVAGIQEKIESELKSRAKEEGRHFTILKSLPSTSKKN